MELQPTRITIGGERFQVQTDLSAEELQAIIAYVESKMAEHLTPSLRAEPRKQLILMAMEISAELFATKTRIEDLEKARERSAAVAERLLEALSAEIDDPGFERSSGKPSGDPVETAKAFLSPQ